MRSTLAATPVVHGSEVCDAGLPLTSENDVLGSDIPPVRRNHHPVERSSGIELAKISAN
jgi:hypothetical protein